MDFPVSQNMKAYAGIVRDILLERVTTEEIVEVMQVKKGPKRVFVDFLPPHSASKPYTVKVFTVKLRHHRDDQAFSDNVGFIRGLDKHNMPRLGDVMVPPPQITMVSWFDGKSQVAANEPFVPLSNKALGPQQPLQAQTVSFCAFSRVGLVQSLDQLLTCPLPCSSGLGSRRKLWRLRSCSSSAGEVAARAFARILDITSGAPC